MVCGLVFQPRGEVGADQENIPVGTGTAVGSIPVGPSSSARRATTVLGRAFRMAWVFLLVASCSRRAQCSMGETLFPLVVRIPVPMPRASLLLLVSDPWPPCPCAPKLDPLAPCWELPLALLPVELLLFAVVSLVCSCLPWS
jgi:hypothetical protein